MLSLATPQANNLGEKSAQGGASEQVLRDEQEPPIVNMAEDRWESIVNDTPAIFEIAENPNAKSEELLREVDFLSDVRGNEYMYHEVAMEVGIDEKLLMSIAHMETTRGWYDGFTAYITPPKSFRPMNIHYAHWQPLIEELGYTEDDIRGNRRANIHAGAEILRRIQDRIVDPTVEKTASIYVFLGAELTRDYGERVKHFYNTQPWWN